MIGRAEEAEKEEEGFRVEKLLLLMYCAPDGLWIVSPPRYGWHSSEATNRGAAGWSVLSQDQTISSWHSLLSWQNSKSFVFLLNEGAQSHDFAISQLTPRMQISTGISK